MYFCYPVTPTGIHDVHLRAPVSGFAPSKIGRGWRTCSKGERCQARRVVPRARQRGRWDRGGELEQTCSLPRVGPTGDTSDGDTSEDHIMLLVDSCRLRNRVAPSAQHALHETLALLHHLHVL